MNINIATIGTIMKSFLLNLFLILKTVKKAITREINKYPILFNIF